MAFPLAICTVLIVVNAHNMVDGLNRLSGSIGAVGLGGLVFAAWLSDA